MGRIKKKNKKGIIENQNYYFQNFGIKLRYDIE